MKSLKNYLLLALLAVFCFSCTGEDGTDGIDGIDGINGTNGIDGADGINGEDGADGMNGEDGDDGADGVDGADGSDGTNVQTYTFNNPSWGDSGSVLNIDMGSVLTDDNVNNDAILVYVRTEGRDDVSFVPGPVFGNGVYKIFNVLIEDSTAPFFPFYLRIVSRNLDDTFTDNADLIAIENVFVIVVESSSTTEITNSAKGVSKKEAILASLSKAGVDVDDYEAVCDYYGVAH